MIARVKFFRERTPAPLSLREHMIGSRRGVRLGVVLLTVVLAGIFAEAGFASGSPAVDVGSTTSGGAGEVSSPTVPESPPADSPEAPPSDPVEEPAPGETPPGDPVEEPAPGETPPGDPIEEPPVAEAPPPVVEPPELPPVESPPRPQLPEDPSTTSGPLDGGRAATPATGIASFNVSTLFDPGDRTALLSESQQRDASPANGQSPGRGNPSSRPSKADDSLLSAFSSQRSPASSPPSASGAAPAGAGAGFGIPAEFIVPLLVMLSCACALLLQLPHATAYALRSERPG
jgi:hypothetical protein